MILSGSIKHTEHTKDEEIEKCKEFKILILLVNDDEENLILVFMCSDWMAKRIFEVMFWPYS